MKSLEEEIKESSERIRNRGIEFESKTNSLENSIRKYIRWAWIFVILGFAIGGVGLMLYICRDSTSYALNLLGDFYGGTVASLWSLAGLFLIYVAFLGQRQQLLNQQIEIMYSQLEVKYTRLELEGQKKEMQLQNRTLRQQTFENTFFNLMSFHKQTVESLKYGNATGEQFFVHMKNNIKKVLENADLNSSYNTNFGNSHLEGAERSFKKLIHDNYINFLQLYLQSLFGVLKYLLESDLLNEDAKQFYYSIVETSLGRNERRVLFYMFALFSLDNSALKRIFEVEAKKPFLVNVQVDTFHSSHNSILKERIMERLKRNV